MASNEGHLDFTTLIKQIDSKIDQDLAEKIKTIKFLNKLMKCDVLGNEELIPVGSCIDGSKVTVPGDSGDIDVLIVSNKIILKESLFNYDNRHPAFLHVRVDGEHEKYFKTVKDPIEGVYLPVVVLKELRERSFFTKMLLNLETHGGMSKDRKSLNVTRPSAVGKELMQLYPYEQNAVIDKPKTLKVQWTETKHLIRCMLAVMLNKCNSCKTTHPEDRFDKFETYKGQNPTDYDNIPLMLQTILDMSTGENTDESNIRHTPDLNEDRQTDASVDGNHGVLQWSDKEIETNETARDMFTTRSFEGYKNKTKLPNYYRTNESSRTDCYCDSVLYHECKNKRAIDFDPVEEDKSSTRGADIKKSTETDYVYHECKSKRAKNIDTAEEDKCSTRDAGFKKSTETETVKIETSFAKLKSTDYVPAFRFEGWPRVADEWLTRKRKWPSKVTIKTVLESGCQVIAKRPFALQTLPEEKDPYFRLSFALSEIILAKSMKEKQLLCWRVLKAYQKCFLETRPKCLTSYHWKNVVFWVSEDLDESFWSTENVLVVVLKCLEYMENCLQKQYLPFYFVRKMNLFDGRDETLLGKLRVQVGAIQREPLVFLNRFLKEPSNHETLCIDINEIEDILNQEVRTNNLVGITEEMFNGFISQCSSLCKTDDHGVVLVKELQRNVMQLLKKCFAEKEKSSSDSKDANNANILLETLFSELEMTEKSKGSEDEVGFFKSLGDLFQSVVNNKEFSNENDTDSKRALKESLLNVFSTLSAVFPGKQKTSSRNTSDIFDSLHNFSMKMQEEIEAKHNTCNVGEESKVVEGIRSTVIGVFPKLIEGIQKSIDYKDVSVANEIRKVINVASKKIETIIESEDKNAKKSEMDIDLD